MNYYIAGHCNVEMISLTNASPPSRNTHFHTATNRLATTVMVVHVAHWVSGPPGQCPVCQTPSEMVARPQLPIKGVNHVFSNQFGMSELPAMGGLAIL